MKSVFYRLVWIQGTEWSELQLTHREKVEGRKGDGRTAVCRVTSGVIISTGEKPLVTPSSTLLLPNSSNKVVEK